MTNMNPRPIPRSQFDQREGLRVCQAEGCESSDFIEERRVKIMSALRVERDGGKWPSMLEDWRYRCAECGEVQVPVEVTFEEHGITHTFT